MRLSEIVGAGFLVLGVGCTTNATKHNYQVFKSNFPDSIPLPENALETGVEAASTYRTKDTVYIKGPDNKLFPVCVNNCK